MGKAIEEFEAGLRGQASNQPRRVGAVPFGVTRTGGLNQYVAQTRSRTKKISTKKDKSLELAGPGQDIY